MIFGFFAGLLLGGSLIIAIGAQNAFVLRQGILRQHVFILCLICSLSDALLILIGVLGIGALIESIPSLLTVIRLMGAAFLLWYASVALRRALHPESMTIEGEGERSQKVAVLTCLAFTFLNPHVYLDTVLLIGASAPSESTARTAYTIGAMLASFIWFFSLGYGARFLAPVFQNPRAWQVLDGMIAFVMLLIAIGLLYPLAR